MHSCVHGRGSADLYLFVYRSLSLSMSLSLRLYLLLTKGKFFNIIDIDGLQVKQPPQKMLNFKISMHLFGVVIMMVGCLLCSFTCLHLACAYMLCIKMLITASFLLQRVCGPLMWRYPKAASRWPAAKLPFCPAPLPPALPSTTSTSSGWWYHCPTPTSQNRYRVHFITYAVIQSLSGLDWYIGLLMFQADIGLSQIFRCWSLCSPTCAKIKTVFTGAKNAWTCDIK